MRLPGRSGIDLIKDLRGRGHSLPIVVISGEASIGEAVEALRQGVHDFIEKPFSKERLLRSIHNALHQRQLETEVADLRSRLQEESTLLGASEAMAELRRRIDLVAPTDTGVLVTGESGTGKELVADAVHRGSHRRDQPFIKVNCAAIPTHLIEDELFGHRQGAFTDARDDKAGLFEEADGGTLFLDEIGDMDLALQSRLLRVLEDGSVRRVGDTAERKVDVRIVAASHRDLEKSVDEETFRGDLYYRLARLMIPVPPLRERPGDATLLFEHFLRTYEVKHRARRRSVEPAVLKLLEAYSWPGNVRELQSLCERLVVLGSDPLDVGQVEGFLHRTARAKNAHSLPTTKDAVQPLRQFKSSSEKQYLERVLSLTGFNVAAAARLLDIQRSHLHQKLSQLGIERPKDGP